MLAPAPPQQLQAPGDMPAWRVPGGSLALYLQPLMEGLTEAPSDAGPVGGGPFNLFKGLA